MAEVMTVSALNRYVKTLFDANDALFDLALRGEIANFVQNARSGHCYFTLRDEECNVKAVMFRSLAARLAFRPEEGMRVVVRCRATLYERDGAFQIYVNEMFPDGIGAAHEVRNKDLVKEISRGYRQSAKAESQKSYIFRNGEDFVNPWRPKERYRAKSLILPDAEKRYDEKQAII